MILNYSKSTERELNTYGLIINILTLWIFHKWVQRNFYDYRETVILTNILHGSGSENYELSTLTKFDVRKKDKLDYFSIVYDTLKDDFVDEISLRFYNNSKDVFIVKNYETVFKFNRHKNDLTKKVYDKLYSYYNDLQLKIKAEERMKLWKPVMDEMSGQKPPTITYNYILVP